jgi:hypothetical protein
MVPPCHRRRQPTSLVAARLHRPIRSRGWGSWFILHLAVLGKHAIERLPGDRFELMVE